jgi:DNA cross-link repair 1A protein
VPPFKRIEGTPFVVDGFAWGAQSSDVHFLTHFHADHYKGITKRWGAPIYASAVTAALVVRRLGVAPSQMIVLPMDVPSEVCGARVTPIDANHCPGAVLLLFELSGGRIVLHTGDFRYTPSMLANPALRALRRPIDMLYLDTTYCDPKHRFPTQAAVVQAVVDRCKLLLDAPRTLILFGSYSIGKERVFLEVGKQCGVRIGVERAKGHRRVDLAAPGFCEGGQEGDRLEDVVFPCAVVVTGAVDPEPDALAAGVERRAHQRRTRRRRGCRLHHS